MEAIATGPFASILAEPGLETADTADEPVSDLYARFDPARVRTGH